MRSSVCLQSKTETGSSGKARESLARILDHVLREECFLLGKTRDYRESVTGPNLYSLHRLFDEQRHQLDYWRARVVERIRSMGLGKSEVGANADNAGAAKNVGRLPARSMIGDLLSRHQRIAHRLRDDIEQLSDHDTAEFLRRLVEFHETTAWMLRVVNNGPGADSDAAVIE